LESASGFQSVQFREIELLLGLRHKRMFSLHQQDSAAYKQLTNRAEESTIWESFIKMLQLQGYDIPTPIRENESGLMFNSNSTIQDQIYTILNENNEIALLCEALVDFDEGLQEWRYRHVKMVERTIGNKMGTGGSDGVGYLKATLFQPVFPDLWEVRTRF
jgi:tryptophan 2,3-dioxygenase